MIVGEPLFLAALVPAAALVWAVPAGLPRQLLVLAVSYAYYLTFPPMFAAILLGMTALTYGGALLLARMPGKPHAAWVLSGLLVITLLPLAFFKYLVPVLATGPHEQGADWQLTMAQVVMPIGLSFYTFAAIGYLIDVYLGTIGAQRNPLRVALFIGFFPYVTAGPIPRARQVLPQLEFRQQFQADRALHAVSDILIGVVMKFWIADSLAVPSANAYANIATITPLEKLVATLFFAFQLYADFAGYSLIAIGTARLLGIELPPNFRQPFLSQSLAEFWQRWHISLLIWLRDYVFTPLSLPWRHHRRVAVPAAMFVTLTLVGIWHGIGWGFLVFGIVHGILLAIANLTRRARDRLVRAAAVPPAILVPSRIIFTFFIVVLTLILIRTPTLGQALTVYGDIFSINFLANVHGLISGDPSVVFRYIPWRENIVNAGLIVALVFGDIVAARDIRIPAPARGFLYAVSILTVCYQVISFNPPKLFVYFQF